MTPNASKRTRQSSPPEGGRSVEEKREPTRRNARGKAHARRRLEELKENDTRRVETRETELTARRRPECRNESKPNASKRARRSSRPKATGIMKKNDTQRVETRETKLTARRRPECQRKTTTNASKRARQSSRPKATGRKKKRLTKAIY